MSPSAFQLSVCVAGACIQPVWKYGGGSDMLNMQQLAHLTQNCVKFLHAGEDKDTFFSSGRRKKPLTCSEKERPKWKKPENDTVPYAIFIACQVRGGRGD